MMKKNNKNNIWSCCRGIRESDMSKPITNREFWMSELPERNHKWLLKEIAIPGSHNSFTYDLTEYNPVCKNSLEPFLQGICSLGFIQTIIFNWSVCQTLTVKEQLLHGVRYFDIRMACKQDCKDLTCVHGLYCDNIKYYLNEIKKFLVGHPKEIVILDFNHFYDMDVEDHKRLCEEIKQIFGSMIIPRYEETHLSTIWENKRQVLINYQYNSVPGYDDIIWPKGTVRSIWPEKSSVCEVIDFLENFWHNGMRREYTVLQGILTPNTNFVFANLTGTLKSSLTKVGMCTKFNDWVASRKPLLDNETYEQRTQANIFLADFVEIGDFTDNVIALNYAGKD